MPRLKGSKNKQKKVVGINPTKEPKHIPDNEIELLSIICKAFEGLSEEGKFRVMAYQLSRNYHYLPKEHQ